MRFTMWKDFKEMRRKKLSFFLKSSEQKFGTECSFLWVKDPRYKLSWSLFVVMGTLKELFLSLLLINCGVFWLVRVQPFSEGNRWVVLPNFYAKSISLWAFSSPSFSAFTIILFNLNSLYKKDDSDTRTNTTHTETLISFCNIYAIFNET